MTIVYNIDTTTIYLLRTSYKPIPIVPADLMHLCISFSSDDTIPIGICTTDNLTHLQGNSIGYFGDGLELPLDYRIEGLPTGGGKLVSPDPLLTRNIRIAKNCEESSFEILSKQTIDVDMYNNLRTIFENNNYPIIEEIKYEVFRTSIYQGTRYNLLSNFYAFLGLDTNDISSNYNNCVTWIKRNIFKNMEIGIFGVPSTIVPFENSFSAYCASNILIDNCNSFSRWI